MVVKRWLLSAYYAEDAPPPKNPGGLAIQIWVSDIDPEKSMDYRVLKDRPDIGKIIISPYGTRRD